VQEIFSALGSGATLVLPVLKPKAYLPVHWDGLWRPFKAGVEAPFSDPDLGRALAADGVRLVAPAQYMDKWRLDRAGIAPLSRSTPIVVMLTTEGEACRNRLIVDRSSEKSSPRAVTVRDVARGSFNEALPSQVCLANRTASKHATLSNPTRM